MHSWFNWVTENARGTPQSICARHVSQPSPERYLSVATAHFQHRRVRKVHICSSRPHPPRDARQHRTAAAARMAGGVDGALAVVVAGFLLRHAGMSDD